MVKMFEVTPTQGLLTDIPIQKIIQLNETTNFQTNQHNYRHRHILYTQTKKEKNSRSFFGVAEWNTILTGGDGSWQRSEGRRELNEPSVLGAARNCFEAMEAAAIEIKTKKELKKKML